MNFECMSNDSVIEAKNLTMELRKTTTLLGGRRKLVTPHIPQRKKVTFAKSSTHGSKAKQFQAAKER